ncbi:MAG: outer membrane protein [Maribacter sp.]|jgi:outer membrane protein
MKNLKFIPLVVLLLIGTVQSSIAQKVGHMNSDLLLSQMPDMKSANSQLETFSSQKEKEITSKIDKFDAFYTETMKAAQEGKLSPVEQSSKEAELQRRQASLQDDQKAAQNEVMKKQEELLQPIIEKVDNAIKKVGEENGYDYIFNTNAGHIIHSKDSDDVTALVKKVLGI